MIQTRDPSSTKMCEHDSGLRRGDEILGTK
jgi:hypothetical protein